MWSMTVGKSADYVWGFNVIAACQCEACGTLFNAALFIDVWVAVFLKWGLCQSSPHPLIGLWWTLYKLMGGNDWTWCLAHKSFHWIWFPLSYAPIFPFLTRQGLCPLDHMHKLSFTQFIEAREQGCEGVRLVVVMSSTHHTWLNGFQDIQKDGLTLITFNVWHCQLLGWLLSGAGGAGSFPFLL